MLNLSDTFKCAVCGGKNFTDNQVLWPELMDECELSHEEAMLIHHQQATHCTDCHTTIRSGALAKGICAHFDFEGSLLEFIDTEPRFTLLEINEAGTLHPHVSKLPGHVYCAYPNEEMKSLSFDDNSFSMVIHSDTLEHMVDPRLALKELHRVLEPGGVNLFTVPIIQGRLNRSQAWLAASYHGQADEPREDLLVHTELAADLWVMVLDSGYQSCDLITHPYPSGIAVSARK